MSSKKEISDFLANKNLCFFALNQLNTKAPLSKDDADKWVKNEY